MNEEKKVPFKWEYGEETISLQLGMYANNQRLYIGMITHTEDGEEPFADMTVNLPGYSLDPGEAFISGDISKDWYAAGENAKQPSVRRGAGPGFRAHRKAALSQGGHHSRRL